MPSFSPGWRKAVGAGVGALFAEAALAQDRSPVEVGLTHVSDTFANIAGGRDEGVRVMGLLDLAVEIEGAAFGMEGAEAFIDLQFLHGRSLTDDLVGDAQVVSNIDAPNGVRPLEAWIAVPFAEKGYLKTGLIDLNGEFDVQSVGSLFLNSSHGIGPDFSQSGLNGPSIFPTTSTAAVIGWNEAGWSARLGLFDAVSGDPDRPRRTVIRFPGETGLLIAAEADFKIAPTAELQLGAWTYTSRFETLDEVGSDGTPLETRGNRGAYAMVEGSLTRYSGKSLDGWVRIGVAETRINPIGLYTGGGFSLGDEESRWGLAVAHARLGDPAIAAADAVRPDRAETIVELTYARALSDRIAIQPDIQYVINPGWDPELDNALVAGVRLEISLF